MKKLTVFSCKRVETEVPKTAKFRCLPCGTKFQDIVIFKEHKKLCEVCNGNHEFAIEDAHMCCLKCGARSPKGLVCETLKISAQYVDKILPAGKGPKSISSQDVTPVEDIFW